MRATALKGKHVMSRRPNGKQTVANLARFKVCAYMPKKFTLSNKLLALGTVFLFVALASIGFTLWVTWELQGGAAAVNEAGRLRMNMLRMVVARQNESLDHVAGLEQRFDQGLELLRTGDPARPLFVPWSDETRARYERLVDEWQAIRQEWNSPMILDSRAAVARGDAYVSEIDDFVGTIELQIMRWTASLHLFQLFLVGLAIAAAVAFMAISYWLVLHPVTRLQEALAAMRRGELGTRLEVESDDEFGQLTEGFNQMARALQALHDDLERKVREKTVSVEEQNQRLAALYAVSALSEQADDLQALAQGFAQQVRQVTGADAAMVRWLGEEGERYLLLASDGLPHRMAEYEHCLEAGTCTCGPLPSLARLRVIPIHAEGAGQAQLQRQCEREGFETLVSVPVRVHQRLLGEITLLYRSQRTLARESRELLETMAQHLASAMEGLRASALEREAAVAQERALIARELHDSIAQSLAFLKIQTQLLRDAIAKGRDSARDQSLAELEEGVRECYADVRELLVHFRTRTQDEDIEAALLATLSKFEHQSGLKAELAMHGQGLPLAPDVQIQVLHIVQEALSNVRKHAGAQRVRLTVQRHPCWHFEVHDDGQGFDPLAVPPDSLHVGLGIMRERAERIGAELILTSQAGVGTTVVLTVPPATPSVNEPVAATIAA